MDSASQPPASPDEAEVVRRALERPPGPERNAFLDGACGDDEALRVRVDLLVRERDVTATTASSRSESAARVSTSDIAAFCPASPDAVVPLIEGPGDKIGRYKLLQKIGEGGCGVVYMAEQEEPVRRRVALKIIKLGMDTESVVARFEAEQQALAMMDHPNIAKVFDAGATELGRPYFVMELVRGVRITDYCDQNNLSTQQRLDLFIKVCQAIQHAHQKGIIHRDIKPSNILVTVNDGVPVVKVIDFGIAKATQGRLTDKTLFTAFEQFIGTPAYMSPEQAEMTSLDIDTRSDIYSLGVLLYELLTGTTPFDTKELLAAGLDELRRTIREKEPMRPSTRLSALVEGELTTTAKRRQADPPKLIHLIRGDLDWIVMKTLEKDRTRRYETANGLSMDIQRHLSHEPVLARPSSNLYRLRRLARRNQAAFIGATVAAVALILGLVASTVALLRERDARRTSVLAETAAKEARLSETQLRRQAEDQGRAARQRAYASDMNLVQQALGINNIGRAQELLSRHHPEVGQPDLRGWEWRYLWQHGQSDARFTLCQRSNNIWALAVSSDSRWVAVGEHEFGQLTVWNLEHRRQAAQLPAGQAEVTAAFSPTSSLLAYACRESGAAARTKYAVRLWDASSSRHLGELALGGPCHNLAFSSDGQTLVTSTTDPDHRITLWRVPDGEKRATFQAFQENSDSALPFAVTTNLSLAAHGPGLGRIRVVDLTNGKELWTAKATDEKLMALAISPDGKTMASGAGFTDSTIKLWDVATGKETGRLEGHRAWVSSLVFLSDNSTLVSASADQTIRLWHVPSLQPLGVLRGHRLEVWRLALAPGTTTLVSGSKDGSVAVWDAMTVRNRRTQSRLPEAVSGWCFTADSKAVLTVNHQGEIARWEIKDFSKKQILAQARMAVTRACFGSGAKRLAIALASREVQVWDLEQSALPQRRVFGGTALEPIQFTAQNRRLIAVGLDDAIEEWDVEKGKRIASWRGAADLVNVAVSPDDRWCLTLGYRGSARLRDMVSGTDTDLDWQTVRSLNAAFSLDGSRLAVASEQGFARIWRVADWTEEAKLRGFLLGVHDVTWSPDSRRLVTASAAQEAIRIWDVNSRQELLTFAGSGGIFGSPQFSDDGNALGALSGSHILHLWLAPSWEDIRRSQEEPGEAR